MEKYIIVAFLIYLVLDLIDRHVRIRLRATRTLEYKYKRLSVILCISVLEYILLILTLPISIIFVGVLIALPIWLLFVLLISADTILLYKRYQKICNIMDMQIYMEINK